MAEVTFTDANFKSEVLNSAQPVLVDFWAAWCGPCRIQGPIVSEVAKEFEGRAKVGKFDVDASPATPQQYGVLSIPSLMVFKAGKVVWQGIGVQQKLKLTEAMNKALGS